MKNSFLANDCPPPVMKRRHFIKRALTGAALASVARAFGAESSEARLAPAKALELAGTEASCPTSYRRLFPGLVGNPGVPGPQAEAGLKQLGLKMLDTDHQVGCENTSELPPAGYTYLGQFIDHDLTFDLTPLAYAVDKPDEMQNFRTPFLDLDHVYGGGPNLSPFLYDKGNRGAERFLLGKTKPAGGLQSREEDLPRNSQGTALVGDPRQDENLIIAQLHLAFLKLHNLVVGNPENILNDPVYHRAPHETDFAVAQRVVRWHYQWIVRHDYLSYVLHPTVFDHLGEKFEKPKRAKRPVDWKIPIEFSAAAFRFGHSMVRDVYKTGVNKKHGDFVCLIDLLHKTGLVGGAAPALPADWAVCWNRFFFVSQTGGVINRSRRFDTKIARELHKLQIPSFIGAASPIKPFSARLADEPLEPSLPVRTLLRGFRMNLPSGEAVAAKIAEQYPGFGISVLDAEAITSGDQHDILTNPEYGFLNNTPLWYYILKEAEITETEIKTANRTEKRKGARLGLVGSCIVADVIIGALTADPDSYFSVPEWKPTLINPDLLRDPMGQLLGKVFPKQAQDQDPRCHPAVLQHPCDVDIDCNSPQGTLQRGG
jgi:hypothetical protein